jgi:glycosyltransferase involved in cell wall biosynthesis
MEDIEWLKSQTFDLGIAQNVIFTGWVDRLQPYILAADLGVSPIVPLPIYTISSPTKLVETLAAARPVVANDIPDQQKILAESGGGLCTAYEERAFADAIVWLLRHPAEAQAMGQRGRTYIETHRSHEVLARHVLDAYARLLDRGT